MAKTKTKTSAKPSGTKKRRGVKLQPTELVPSQIAVDTPSGAALGLVEQVASDGGAVLASYREPLGGHVLLLVALPVEKIEPTPYQREVSDAHVRRLTVAMDKTKRFLDPLIVVYDDEKKLYLTPNGNHRLTALKELGAKTAIALLVPEKTVAYQILALNIEKAYNLREKAIEVVRLYRELARLDGDDEESYALEFEEPALITLGFGYEKRPRLSGGAYFPVLRKIEGWQKARVRSGVAERERRAGLVLDFDDAVGEAVEKLKARGFKSPYLRTFVVARVNPIRFIKGTLPPLDELLPSMTRRARALNPDKIRPEDVARTGGAPEGEG
ncbi:MAG TPA: ParB N-terminal domain-containing protein [Polyangiaceae bacterium]|nr:ParB N-terminal domain-containing protein [Polyangiaceae bacterium]